MRSARDSPRSRRAGLWRLLQPFAGYSFNRAHSACYGLIAYQTAYLKAHYPVEYISALLTAVRDSKDEKTKYLAVARKMGVEVLAPDVNRSQSEFAPDPEATDRVRFGLAGIRNVGEGVVEHILAARRDTGVFKDFFDFCWRVDVTVLNKRTIESLIKAGAFDSMSHERGGLLEVFEQVVEQIASARRKERDGLRVALRRRGLRRTASGPLSDRCSPSRRRPCRSR